jgi:hypothetical protein
MFFFSCFMPRIVTRDVLDVSLLVRQLKHMDFICNALNCLNEENKSFSNSLFRSPSLSNFLFIFSYFMFIYQYETIKTYRFYL